MLFCFVSSQESWENKFLRRLFKIISQLHKILELFSRHQNTTIEGFKCFFISNVKITSLNVHTLYSTLDCFLSCLIHDLGTQFQVVVLFFNLSVLAHFNHSGVKVSISHHGSDQYFRKFHVFVIFEILLNVIDDSLSWFSQETLFRSVVQFICLIFT